MKIYELLGVDIADFGGAPVGALGTTLAQVADKQNTFYTPWALGAPVPLRAEGVGAAGSACERSEPLPARRALQGGSREKTVVRWSGATSRQR